MHCRSLQGEGHPSRQRGQESYPPQANMLRPENKQGSGEGEWQGKGWGPSGGNACMWFAGKRC